MNKLRFVFVILGLFLIVPALQILNLNSQKDRFIIAGKSKSTVMQKIDIPRKKILDRKYPGYGFTNNAGYGVKLHLDALKTLGVTPIHRQTFKPIHNILYEEN